MKCRKLSLMLLVVGSLCSAQDAVETNLYLAFNKEGPIAVGRITAVNTSEQNAVHENGILTFEVTEQLRGEPLPHSLDISYAWIDPNSQDYLITYAKGPPPGGFNLVRPVVGMRMLIIFPRRKPDTSSPLAVLNLDAGGDKWYPIIKRALEITNLTGEAKTNALLEALADPSKFMRVIAIHFLQQAPECRSGSSCCDRAVEILSKRAENGASEKERLQAIDWLELNLYDASAKDTTSNRLVVSNLLSLITDSNRNVRRQAVENLDRVFSPDMKWRPDPGKLAIPNRAEIMRVLKEEKAEGGESAKKAEHLANVIGVSKE